MDLKNTVVATILCLLAVGSVWVWLLMKKIGELGAQMKDYLLVMPSPPETQARISARLFEAMRQVCTLAERDFAANQRYKEAKSRKHVLVSEADSLFEEYLEASRELEGAVALLIKLERKAPASPDGDDA